MAKKRKLDSKISPSTARQPQPAEDQPSVPVEEVQPKEEPIAEEPPITDENLIVEHDEELLSSSDPDQKPQTTEPSYAPADFPVVVTSNGVEGEEDDDEEEDPALILKLIEPLPKAQVYEVLVNAAVKHPDVLKEVRRIADLDPAHRKIFVHGLGWDTNADTLRAVFSKYGEIEDCNAVKDKATGKSKGYGFILFKFRAGARRALKQPQKKIGNRTTSCQLASAGPVPPPPPPVSEYTQRKIFVSNVGADLDPLRLLHFFAKFGDIEEGPLGLDKVTGKPKGFALFVYKTVESAKKALEEPHKNYEGHILHCQKAIDGPKPNKMGYQFQIAGAQHGGLHQGSSGVSLLGSRYVRNENAGYLGGVGNQVASLASTGHLMAPAGPGLGFNQAAQSQAAAASATGLNPAIGQALSALLAQGGGLGMTNLLGNYGSASMGGPVTNTGVTGQMGGGHGMQVSFGNQLSGVGANMNSSMVGGYGASAAVQGGYSNTAMGQGGSGRSQSGFGHMGGIGPYTGH